MVNYPEDWKSLVLGDLGNVLMCRRIFQDQTKPSGQIPFYKIGTFGGKADAFITRELFEAYKTTYPYPRVGDILISASGTIGRTVVYDGKDSYFQDSNIVWLNTDTKQVDSDFLKLFYQSFPWVNLEGTTIQRLYNSIILNTPIHLPSLSEQKKIAETLTAFDTHITNLTDLIEKKKAIREGALEDLVSGKNRLDGFEDKWETCSLEAMCYLITKQTGFDYTETIKDSLVLSKKGDVIPFIQNKDFEGTSVNLHTDYYIPKSVALSFPQILLDEKCLLISISGKIGNVGVYDNLELAFIGGAICIARLKDKDYTEWVMRFLQSSIGQYELTKSEKTSSHHNLTIEDIRKVIIPIPSKPEAYAINSILADMDTEIASLEEERNKMIKIREGAMDDLLTGKVRLTD